MKIFSFLIIILSAINLYSENYLKGAVVDSISNLPLKGAKIHLIEIDHHCFTGNDGSFEIFFDTLNNATIIVELLGYHTEIINYKISNYNNIIIKLKPTPNSTDEVIVEDNKFKHNNYEIYGIAYEKIKKTSLAETLSEFSGFNVRNMGGTTTRPIYRSFSNYRINILQNGMDMGDLSATSNDHSISKNFHSINKIEISKGVNNFKYTNNINIPVINLYTIDINEIEKNSTDINLLYETNANAYSLGMKHIREVFEHNIGFDYSFLKTDDSYSGKEIVKNSSTLNHDFTAFSILKYNNLILNLNFNKFYSDYNIPGGFIGAHPNGVNIKLEKYALNFNLKYNSYHKFLDGINLKGSFNYYKHLEYESIDIIGAAFYQNTTNLILDINSKNDNKYGNFGLNFLFKDYKVGAYAFTPFTERYEYAFFYNNQFSFDNLLLNFGLRLEKIDNFPYSNFSHYKEQKQRSFLSLSYGLEVNYFDNNKSLNILLSKANRAPSIEELYSRGPHLAAYTYEIGNQELILENSYNINLDFLFNIYDFSFKNSLFVNYYENYITFRNSGDTNWAKLLPIFKTNGVEAIIYGYELLLNYKIANNLSSTYTFNITIGNDLTNKSNLPAIPPINGKLEFNYQLENFLVKLASKCTLKQNKVDDFELPTDGYIIFNLALQYNYLINSSLNIITLEVENLFNTIYYNHLSRIKSVYPEKGFNLILKYKFSI